MTAALIIQGEGRGHISQAISYCQDHPEIEVISILISDQGRDIPFNIIEHFGVIHVLKLKSLKMYYKNGKMDIQIKLVL
jgi:hypothetical protein